MVMSHPTLLIKNGAVAMVVALFGGFALIFSMVQAIPLSPLPFSLDYQIPGTPAGWRILHIGMLLNGIMALVVGLVLRSFAFTKLTSAIAAWGTVIAIWGNFAFYLFGMFAPNHGVTLQGNKLGEASIAGALAFLPAFVGAITLVIAFIVIARAKSID
jgi:hypothetical protein